MAAIPPPIFFRYIIVIIIFLPAVSIPEGGLKIDENKLKGYDYYYSFLVPKGSLTPRARKKIG